MRITKRQVFLRLAIILGILILINILAADYYFRIDFTEDNRYTLSPATKKILKNLEKPVTVTGYFSEDLPPGLLQNRQEFKDLLVEYENAAGKPFVFNFKNPNKDRESEQKAQQKGIRPMLINTRKRDQVQQQRAYMGAVIKIGNQSEVLPAIQPGTALEYKLTKSIKKLTIEEKSKIGILQGQGEPGLQELRPVMNDLKVLYDVETFELQAGKSIPEKFKTIAIIAPTDSFSRRDLNKLNDFLSGGGNILITTSRVNSNLRRQMASAKSTLLESWLENKGIKIKKNLVTDIQCGNITVTQSSGGVSFNSQVRFPYFPVINNFGDHPVSAGLESLFLPFTSEISVQEGDTSMTYTILAKTSKKSGAEPVPTRFNINKQWQKSDFPRSGIPVAYAVEGPLAGKNSSKMVLIGNENFSVEKNSRRDLPEDNANFFINAIDWLSDETGLAGLRTEKITSRPLEQISDEKKSVLKYTNAFGPILIIIGLGIVKRYLQHRKRMQWLEESRTG